MATDRLRRKLRDTEPNELADLTANFCIIGTPLPELNARNKDANELKPIWQQEARDSQGRRRFHGAFTGGFSAGYYNTVGSKEGWTPGSFRSSRTDKRNGKQPEGGVGNRVEDFMDEEDLEDWKAAQHISTASRFGGSNDDLLAGPRGNIDPLASALFGDIRPSHSGSVGFKILRRMGWKEGQGLGPRVDAKKRARLLSLISSSSDASTFATSSDVTSEDMKYLYAPPPTPLLMLTVTRNGSRRGLGAEDKPTLHQTLAKDYKPSVAVASATSEEVWPDGRPLLSGFRLASHQLPLEPTFTMEPVPEGWRPDPSRVWNLYAPPSDTKPSDLTPSSRGQLLGEAKAPGPPPNIAAFLSAKARERLGVDSNVALPSTPASSRLLPESVDAPRLDVDTAKQALQGFAPFGADPSRQERYRTYLKGQVDAGSEEAHRLPVPQHMTVEQFANELRDFAKSATIFRPVSSAIAGRFTTASAAAMEHETKATSATPGLRQPMPAATLKHQEDDEGGGSGPVKELSVAQKAAQMGNFGHLTRKIEPWVPERLLCKRFGVPEPATSRKWGTEGLESTTTRDKIGGVEIQDDLDPFYGSTRSTKTQSSSARVDQYWERTKEQLKALGAGPMPLSLDAQSSLRPASTASFASEEIVDDTTVGMGEDERQGWDTLKYVKPSLDVYKAIFASDEEASDVEDTTAAKPGSTAKPKMPNPSSGSRVVFQARSKRKDTDADAEKTTHTSAPTKRKEKGSKKLLLTFDMDDDGDTVEVQKKDKRPKKSSSTFDVDGSTAATGTCPMLNRPTNLKKKARIRASDLF